ncbi:Hypothetical protein NTJ_08748 [Nesidiocoris tenuis]|uniref:Uncharacterized protein n=1 Tax=Nesidiocoris tenuis TaxID=355587 RepID=A0ABN7AXB0_9HEMI|nr:Hypothetical protein NTJ_08748 [Nesidiocoris tenuis]
MGLPVTGLDPYTRSPSPGTTDAIIFSPSWPPSLFYYLSLSRRIALSRSLPRRASANSDLLPLPVTFRDSAAASLQVYRIATSYCQDLAAAPAAAPAAKRHATASAISLYEPRAKSGAFSNHCVHKFVPSAPAARSLRRIIRRLWKN